MHCYDLTLSVPASLSIFRRLFLRMDIQIATWRSFDLLVDCTQINNSSRSPVEYIAADEVLLRKHK